MALKYERSLDYNAAESLLGPSEDKQVVGRSLQDAQCIFTLNIYFKIMMLQVLHKATDKRHLILRTIPYISIILMISILKLSLRDVK